MQALTSLQEDNFDKLQKALRNFKKSPKERLIQSYIETRLETLEDLWKDFKSRHLEIIVKASKEEKTKLNYFVVDVYEQFEELYTEYKCMLKDKLCPSSLPSNSVVPPGPTTYNQCEVKLPVIQLPTFSGKYEEWQTFHDMFLSLIHNNKNLTAVQKLHYLKGSLSGEPDNLLRNLSTTEDNYSEAWKQLIKRYNNKRYNCNAIFKNLFAQKQINFESASAIRQLLDTTSSCLKALNNIGVKTDTWDAFIIYLVVSKLDKESHRQWENLQSQMVSEEFPIWQQLADFLESRFRALEMVDTNKFITKQTQIHNTSKPPYNNCAKSKSFHAAVQEDTKPNDSSCIMCNGPHLLYHCKKFGQQTPQDRQEFVQSKRLCFNCLSPTHSVKRCRQSTCCRKCGRRHHSLLHFYRTDNQESTNNTEALNPQLPTEENPPSNLPERRIVANFAKEDHPQSSEILIPTAIIKANSRNSYKYVIRALLDQGSQASFVTEATAQLLGLKRTPVNAWVSGLGDGNIRIKHLVLVQLESRHNPAKSIQVEAYVLSSFTSMLPASNIIKPVWPALESVQLADPAYTSPGKIDILLGAEVYSKALLPGLIKHQHENLTAQDTIFGWIVSGKGSHISTSVGERKITLHIQAKEDYLLKLFWDLENEPDHITKKLTKTELRCEEIYDTTTTRNEEGRFIVKLPFESEDPECQYGKTREIATRRYNLLEKRLMKNPTLYTEYQRVLEEYIVLNHMSLIEDQKEIDNPKSVYIPHHAIVREDKDTTKLRVVFDASCKGVNNISLNDNLLVGPKLQQDLRHILMRWRSHPIAVVADLIKMYRQVRVRDKDTNYQRILWKPNINDPLKHYKLLTLTFGTACAPYLAVKTLNKLAEEEETKYPLAAEITKRDYYVDDLMTGCETEEEGVQIYEEMNKLMNSGGFQLQKWSTNNERLLNHIGDDKHNIEQTIPIKADNMVKVLGINWNRNTDNFEYTVKLPELNQLITKRQVLSDIARLYDPIGWIAPVVVRAKLFIQKLWKSGLAWDDELPCELLAEWLKYREGLIHIKNILIPRWLHSTRGCKFELHAFSDASRAAFAAVVYIRVIDEHGNINVSLVTAKTKVAPIEKEISIPRLELCGATLAAKLLSEVSQIMKVPKEQLYAWTDSTVVLAWLKGLPNRWTTFVSNRVSNILTILDFDQWGHVSTNENPADCASRGVQPSELSQQAIWWHGPEWLSNRVIDLERQNFTTKEEERGIKSLTTIQHKEEDFLWIKYSTLSKMLRILSWCRRFLNMRKPKQERQNMSKLISNEEINQTLNICIKQVQEFEFGDELKHLRTRGYLPKKSMLHSLCPIFDQNGILRVGGRIHLARTGYNTKHPIILPAKSHLTKLIIADAHVTTLHGDPQVMLNYLRTKYWIVRARDQVKKHYRGCVTCLRYSKANKVQLMGQLPEVRLTPSKAFKSSGVDYAGPISIRFSPGRGAKSYKGYICLFVCMVTRAVHLEAVSDLTAKGFIAAFKRFTARRGHCQDLYSDNGTNFVGADKLLHDMFDVGKSEVPNEIAQLLTLERTTWHFIPPHAPNFGGLWEAGVRSTKAHLRRVIGDNTLTYEELATVLAQIEACLNSRPLTSLSDDPDDPLPLTPGHFLVGEPLINIIDEDQSKYNINGLERWRLTQRMVNDFWKRWSKEYIVNLNQRYKWNIKRTEPDVGDIVVVRDDNLPPAKWILGRIVEKHEGKDNIVRVVTIKCKNSLLKRPVSKICVLPK